MVTKLYLIRHGETEDAQPKRYKGHLDVPLSEKGIEQMERLAQYIVQLNSSKLLNIVQSCSKLVDVVKDNTTLNNIEPSLTTLNKISAVYCSDLSRAVKSAELIAEPHKLKPIIMPELRERNFGIWEGMAFNEIREKYPQEFEAWADNPLQHSPMGGESTIEVRDRAIGALNRILNEVQDSSKQFKIVQNSSTLNNIEQLSTILNNVVVVSHGGINRIVLCHFLEIPLENIFRIEQDYGALNILEFYDNYPVVKLINYIV